MLTLFPFPYILNGERINGLRLKWPDRCLTCSDLRCQLGTFALSICPYGYNYIDIRKYFTIAGVIVKEYVPSTPARKKLLKQRIELITFSEIEQLKSVLNELDKKQQEEIEDCKAVIIEEYKNQNLYKQDFLNLLKPELDRAFSTLHEYRHFVSQIAQNINVILETRYSGLTIDDKLNEALHAEKAIYWMVQLMQQTLTAALVLKNPERVMDISRRTLFSLHPFVLKHLRIYQMAFDEANIEVKVSGKSEGKIFANSEMIGIIVHTFIDNAYKYSPKNISSANSTTQERVQVIIRFEENNNSIKLSVVSNGPRISEEEKSQIFEPFIRAAAAMRQEEEGTGFGLYIARVIAKSLGTDITVQQENRQTRYGHLTTFSILFNRVE